MATVNMSDISRIISKISSRGKEPQNHIYACYLAVLYNLEVAIIQKI